MLNFTAIDLQLYKIFKITRVSFWGHTGGEENCPGRANLRGNMPEGEMSYTRGDMSRPVNRSIAVTGPTFAKRLRDN